MLQTGKEDTCGSFGRHDRAEMTTEASSVTELQSSVCITYDWDLSLVLHTVCQLCTPLMSCRPEYQALLATLPVRI